MTIIDLDPTVIGPGPPVGSTLGSADWEELGIDEPRGTVEAFRVDVDTINVVVLDEDGAYSVDDPSVDHSGDDGWQWIAFDNGRQRDAYIDNHPEHHPDSFAAIPPGERTFVWIERYEHSLVRYAPLGEASMVDRQWDVAQGVAVIVFDRSKWGPDFDAMAQARAICDEYTSWCNGDVYGIVTFGRRPPVTAPHSPVLIPDEYLTETWEETDSCWGFVGHDYAIQAAKENWL